METITLNDAGPIRQITVPCVPGVIVLRGRNDAGKSQALEAIGRLAGGNGHVTPRDGSKRGEAEGLGVRVTFGASQTRRTGELEALSIEGKLSIDQLVDPRIKDPEAADRHRIKALLQLTGAKADLDQFAAQLFPEGGREELDYYLDGATIKADDMVDVAGKIKRALEDRSRAEAGKADHAEIQAAACKQQTAGINLDAETDTARLQAELEDAAGNKSKLDEQVRAAKKAKADATEARGKLAAATGDSGLAMAEAQKALQDAEVRRDAAKAAADDARRKVERIEAELAAAKLALTAAEDSWGMAGATVATARQGVEAVKRNAEAYAGWQAAIDAAASVVEPSADHIAAAAIRVDAARQAIEAAAVVRLARQKADEAEQHADTARNHRTAAEALREAAKSTDDVLSQAVASENLFVEGGRLVTKCGRGTVPYGERSQGTRWRIALDEAVRCIRELGAEGRAVIVASQEAFESLDPDNRAEVHRQCIERGVTLYTAEADRGDLRSEVYEPAAN